MYASADDVLERWLGGNPPAEEIIDTYISDAETLVNFEFPDLAAAVEADEFPIAQVRFVVCQMVTRALRNPDNVRQSSQTVDSYSESFTYAGSNPGSLWLTDQERVLLSSVGPPTNQTAFTIDTVPTDLEHPVLAWLGTPWPYDDFHYL